MKLSFTIMEVSVEYAVRGEPLGIVIAHERDKLYRIHKKLRVSSGYKTLVKIGAGYEWAYLPSKDFVEGTLEECKTVLEEMFS